MADPTAQPTDSDALNLEVSGIIQLKPQGADSDYLYWSFVVLLHLKSLKLAYVLDPVDTTSPNAKPLASSWANDSIAVSFFIARAIHPSNLRLVRLPPQCGSLSRKLTKTFPWEAGVVF
ncbi:uncharacterized protein PGTG_13006 [Puccinia graminis f. sp. tritici CRL 75-36-700-3]|uniref:Uncharacterized protein n=1 Tax=Puccinia graminis f. sp. tritici (strain CRL 75-36-700-3 / race SCCL) TaxID=418459 RepID=E3KQP9_PUCGT|nr:uncharacterized protein PGTG_13006 [Puccinia graminis f. sp. tritici CRL 75-36-700-3]EFP86624.1 hypothetical protein PGTG_13006 [Puccinia graminis f. sp. tritici CRL 75-36-700-3]